MVPTNVVQQDGIGTVTADMYNTFLQSVAFLSGLQNFVGTTGMIVTVSGLASYNDGLQGSFYWNAGGSANDGVNNILPNGNSVGCWTRIANTPSGGTLMGNLEIDGTLGVTGNTSLTTLTTTGLLTASDGISTTNITASEFIGSGAGLTSIPGSALVGTSAGSFAPAGDVGEFQTANTPVGTPIALTSSSPASIVSITLTPGDWDIWATIQLTGGGSTTVTFLQADINATAGAISGNNLSLPMASNTPFGAGYISLPLTMIAQSFSSPATLHLNVEVVFGTSTCSGFGSIYARRRR